MNTFVSKVLYLLFVEAFENPYFNFRNAVLEKDCYESRPIGVYSNIQSSHLHEKQNCMQD